MMKPGKIYLSVVVGALVALAGVGLKAANNPDAVEVYEEAITRDTTLPGSAKLGANIFFNPGNVAFDPNFDKYLAALSANGITEVIYSGGLQSFNHKMLVEKPNLDSMDTFMEAAKRQNIKVWVMFNWNMGNSKAKVPDLMSKAYLEGQCRLIDAIAEKNQKYGNIVGFFWDEMWCSESQHLYPDYVNSFKAFCRTEYGEEYSEDAMPVQQDPANKWWRRFVVFKNCVYENFSKKLWDYGKQHGFKVMTRTVPSQAYGNSAWKWGLDSYRISKIGDCDWIVYSRSYEGNMYENTVMGPYMDLTPLDFAWMIRGYPVNYLAHVNYLFDPEIRAKYNELVKLAKEWKGAQRLAEVGILSYPVNLIGSFKDPTSPFSDNEVLLTGRLSQYFETDMLDIRDTRFYGKYKVLIAPQYCGYSIPEYAWDDLVKWVKQGGILIALNTVFAVGKRDLTDPRDVTEELCGVKPGKEKQMIGSVKFAEGIMNGAELAGEPMEKQILEVKDSQKVKVLAASANNAVITETSLGQGKVIYVNLGLAERIKKDNKWLRALAGLESHYHTPAITSEGDLNIESAIRKDGRLMISLYPATEGDERISSDELRPDDQPGDKASMERRTGRLSGVLKINPAALGLKEKEYQLFRMSEYKLLPKAEGEKYWTAQDLQAGVPVNISEEAGYENLVIEAPGTEHKGESILAQLRVVKEEDARRVKAAKEHPMGLRKDPFKDRVRVQQSDVLSKAGWRADLPHRIAVSVENQLGMARPGEPVIISGAEIIKAARTGNIRAGSLRVYENKDGEQKEVPSQVDGSGGDVLKDGAEVVFVTDLPATGKKDFLIYFGDRESTLAKYEGITIADGKDAKGKAVELITTGLIRGELKPNGEVGLYDEPTGKPVVNLGGQVILGLAGQGAGISSANGKGKCQWAIKGPVHSRVIVDAEKNGIKMQNAYDFYHGSPFVLIRYLSDAQGKGRCIYWPVGSLLGESAGASALTEKGWWNLHSTDSGEWLGLKPFKANTRIIVKQEGTSPFGWLLAYSDIASPPYLILSKNKGGGYFYIEFAKHHAEYTPVDHPEVEWVYVHNVGDERQLDNYARSIKEPLVVMIGEEEKRP